MEEMREITDLQEIKRTCLNILIAFDSFCKKYDIEYMLYGGTLLGCIRHKGFIPWDDDIDVWMTRPNYEKFINQYISDESNFKHNFGLNNFMLTKNYYKTFSKLYDKNTYLYEIDMNNNYYEGMFIDIFPIDSVFDNKILGSLQIKILQFIKLYLIASNYNLNYKRDNISIIKKCSIYIVKIISIIFKPKYAAILYDKCSKWCDFGKSKYVMEDAAGLNGKNRILDIKLFQKIDYGIFENYVFPIPKEYDQILTQLYGDYMKLPSIDQRIPHHSFKIYKKTNGYKEVFND